MDHINIVDFKEGMSVISFYLVKRAEVKIASVSKKQYLDVMLVDKTGEVNAKIWNVEQDAIDIFVSGKLVKIKANVKLWNEKPQLTIHNYRMVVAADNQDINKYVPSAPGDVNEYYDYIISRIDMMKNRNMSMLVRALVLDKLEEFKIYPAAKSNHHAVRSGLIYHEYRMLKLAEAMKTVYDDIDIDLLNAGIILHDLYKIEEMDISELGLVTEYTAQGNLLGHITMGVVAIERKAFELGIEDECVLLLKHMVLSHHYYPEYGSPKFPMFLEAELLHHIDMIDARVYDFADIYKGLEGGNMSEPIFSLDRRRVYKPKMHHDEN